MVAEAPPPLEKSVSSETSTGGGSLSETVAHRQMMDSEDKRSVISRQLSAKTPKEKKLLILQSLGVLLLVDCSQLKAP